MGHYQAGLLESDDAYELRAAVLRFAGLGPDDVDELDPDEVAAVLSKAMPALVQLLRSKEYDEDREGAETLADAEPDKTVYAVIVSLALDYSCTLSPDDHAALGAGLAELPLLADLESVKAARVTALDEDDDAGDDEDELLRDEAENMRQLAADFDDLVPR
jgi:hypothetical protein